MTKRRILAMITVCAVTTSVLAVAAPAHADVYTPSNPTVITMSAATVGDASPFPTSIDLYGAGTTITDVDVRLNSLAHDNPDDLDIELVGPDGTAIALMSDVCGSTNMASSNITLDDQAANSLPDNPGPACTTGSFKPTDVGTGSEWQVPPTGTTLAAFTGKNPNGRWNLYVRDDTAGSAGSLGAGWTLTITTAGSPVITMPSPASPNGAGVAGPYPYSIPVSGAPSSVFDLNVTLPGLSHTNPGDLDLLLVGPTGAKVMIMSDACGSFDVLNVTLTLDDQAASYMSSASPGCTSGSYRPTDNITGETMPAPAPGGPYPSTLATFNGTNPNGTWQLYISDDNGADAGFFNAAPTLTFGSDTVAPDTTLTKKPKTSTKTSAKVKFTSTEASTFQCKRDKKKWKSCTSPFKVRNLKVGKHKIQVRAIDLAGLVDASPAKVTWKVKKP